MREKVQRTITIVEASYHAHYSLEKSLREIELCALNAIVIVNRHGLMLSGYAVIAQAFMGHTANLKKTASHLHEATASLVQSQMRILQYKTYVDDLRRTQEVMNIAGEIYSSLNNKGKTYAQAMSAEKVKSVTPLQQITRGNRKSTGNNWRAGIYDHQRLH